MSEQSTSHILMVRPSSFQFNEQTAKSNGYQSVVPYLSREESNKKALEEFDGMVDLLQQKGVHIQVVEDTPHPIKPDAIFPNNWISTHSNGDVFLFPMKEKNRRLEKRSDIIDLLKKQYEVKRVIDLSFYEQEDLALEGTGSMILDRMYRKAYACLSPRTEEEVFVDFCGKAGYDPIFFHAYNNQGMPQYHTNIVMSVGSQYSAVGMYSITDENQRNSLIRHLEESNRDIIELTSEQVESGFAGNMLEVKGKDDHALLVLSMRAYQSLEKHQVSKLSKYAELLPVPIHFIETIGGGSARCMMAEIFLPPKQA